MPGRDDSIGQHRDRRREALVTRDYRDAIVFSNNDDSSREERAR